MWGVSKFKSGTAAAVAVVVVGGAVADGSVAVVDLVLAPFFGVATTLVFTP